MTDQAARSEKTAYILIVDSDEISRQLFHAIFYKLNYEIRFCNNAEQAMNEAKVRMPVLVITEIVLPGINGFELRQYLHLLKKDLPIIFVSAVMDSANRKLLENLANDQHTFFLRKPIHKDALLELVRNILRDVYELEQSRSYLEQIQSDLSLAAQMQKLMLPDWITLEDDGFFMTANYVPYAHLSGDYFDLIPLDNGRYFCVVGDISGHGVKAALHMSVVQSLTKLFIRNLHNTESRYLICEYLNNMNRQIFANFEGVFHLTCLAAVVDTKAQKVEYMCAGHPGFWLFRPEADSLEYLPSVDKNIPIGWLADQQYWPEELTVRDFPPDTYLIALTDGVIERSRADGKLLGIDGVTRLRFPDSIFGFCPFYFDRMLNDAGYTEVHDDMLIVTLGFFHRSPDIVYRTDRAIPQSMEQGGILTRSVNVEVSRHTGDKRLAAKAELVAGEFLNNIILHAHEGKMDLAPKILMSLIVRRDRVELVFVDQGKKWDYVPQNQHFSENPTEDFYILSQAGRGMRIIEELVDRIERHREASLNFTRFTFRCKRREGS